MVSHIVTVCYLVIYLTHYLAKDNEEGIIAAITSTIPFLKPKTKFIKLKELSANQKLNNDELYDNSESETTKYNIDDEDDDYDDINNKKEDVEIQPSKLKLLHDRGVLVSVLMYGFCELGEGTF